MRGPDAVDAVRRCELASADEVRKAEVLANAEAVARQLGLPPPALVAELWDQLVEASIAYELEVWDSLRRAD